MDKDRLRAFGMSNLMLEDDLRRIEDEHRVNLRPDRRAKAEHSAFYYRQFDERLRDEAERMARQYAIFYCLERATRQFIHDMMDAAQGAGWWDQCAPQEVLDAVKKNIQREHDAGVTPRSDRPIDYTTFGHLGEIIKQNWDIFGGIFTSKVGVERVMSQLNLLRAPIAHCSPLSDHEADRLELAMKDWVRLSAGQPS